MFSFNDFNVFTTDERGSVTALYKRGIVKGYETGIDRLDFRPNNTITKAELATLIYGILKLGSYAPEAIPTKHMLTRQ